MNSNFTAQLDRRTASIFEGIQVGTVPPDSDAISELAELLDALDDQPARPVVVARLTIIRANNKRTIVEVYQDATFSSFFHYFVQIGNRRSTKEHIRTANRNDGGISQPRLENIAEKPSIYQSLSNPVVKTTIRILKKRAYRKLINAAPDALGLTRTTVNLPRRRFSPLSSRTH